MRNKEHQWYLDHLEDLIRLQPGGWAAIGPKGVIATAMDLNGLTESVLVQSARDGGSIPFLMRIPKATGDLCQNCAKRIATVDWAGEGGWLAAAHGMTSRWCEVCTLREQVNNARAAVARLPQLEQDLEEALRQWPD